MNDAKARFFPHMQIYLLSLTTETCVADSKIILHPLK